MNGVAASLFIAAHILAVACIALVATIERRRAEFHVVSNFRDVLNLIAMATLGASLVLGGFRAPVGFLVGFYHWLILYGVSRLSLRAAWVSSIAVPFPTLLFREHVESTLTELLDSATLW
ncbi:MAG: hypothetical protein HYY84_02755 [Deltaproteobacteria bacterium]|nr:hypothetical protein [Deltaproteobacteria bacterium]